MASEDQSKQGTTGKSDEAAGKNGSAQVKMAGADAVQLLKNDHREVEKLFAEHEKAGTRTRRKAIIEQIILALKIHAELEESIFYPAVRQKADAEDKLDEAQVEHDTVKILIADLESGANSEFRDAKIKVLSEYVKHHVEEEEASGGILEQGRKAGLDLRELGQQMAARKEELQADPSQINAEPVSIDMDAGMGRTQGRAQSAGQRGRRDSNGEGSSFPDRSGRERDGEGRFMSERRGDDERRPMGRMRGEDMQRSSRSGEGHEGSYQRGRSYDDDDRRGRGGRGDDEGRGGWFGDDRGHSEAARRGRGGRGDDEGRGGWFGDGRGHSEAARRGWENRDDDRRSDERRSRSSTGRGREDDEPSRRSGWYGDSRGHSEAARGGWDNRH
jgi:hypothetical protein